MKPENQAFGVPRWLPQDLIPVETMATSVATYIDQTRKAHRTWSTKMAPVASKFISRIYCMRDPVLFRSVTKSKTSQVATSRLLTTSRYQDAYGLQKLVDNKSVSSCQQTWCKLPRYPQACHKLFQHVATSLQMTSSNKPDFNMLVATW